METPMLPFWLIFNNMILRVADIDSFEIHTDYDRPIVRCNYHKGESYEFDEEHYDTEAEALERFFEIQRRLGMI